jgi:hemoglobin
MQTVFEAAGGNDGLRRLAEAWHRRVMADDVVAHAFSHVSLANSKLARNPRV